MSPRLINRFLYLGQQTLVIALTWGTFKFLGLDHVNYLPGAIVTGLFWVKDKS